MRVFISKTSLLCILIFELHATFAHVSERVQGTGDAEVSKYAWCQGSDKVPTSFKNSRVLLFI
jgi:hypothetical protein